MILARRMWTTAFLTVVMKCQLCDYEQELQPGNSDGLILNAFDEMASFEVTVKLETNTTPAKKRMIKAHNAAA
jgi:hypothetical protein